MPPSDVILKYLFKNGEKYKLNFKKKEKIRALTLIRVNCIALVFR